MNKSTNNCPSDSQHTLFNPLKALVFFLFILLIGIIAIIPDYMNYISDPYVAKVQYTLPGQSFGGSHVKSAKHHASEVSAIPDLKAIDSFLSGKGSAVSALASLPAGDNILLISNTNARGPFRIIIHYINGETKIITDETGDYEGKAVFDNTEASPFYMEIISDGEWGILFPVHTVKETAVSSLFI